MLAQGIPGRRSGWWGVVVVDDGFEGGQLCSRLPRVVGGGRLLTISDRAVHTPSPAPRHSIEYSVACGHIVARPRCERGVCHGREGTLGVTSVGPSPAQVPIPERGGGSVEVRLRSAPPNEIARHCTAYDRSLRRRGAVAGMNAITSAIFVLRRPPATRKPTLAALESGVPPGAHVPTSCGGKIPMPTFLAQWYVCYYVVFYACYAAMLCYPTTIPPRPSMQPWPRLKSCLLPVSLGGAFRRAFRGQTDPTSPSQRASQESAALSGIGSTMCTCPCAYALYSM